MIRSIPPVRGLSAVLVLAAALPAGALAQAGPPAVPLLPPSLDPSRVEQRFERPAVPQSVPEIEMPEPEKAPPPKDAERITLTLSAIRIDGNSVYDSDSLAELWRDRLGKAVTLADLYAIRDAVTARYRNDGYVLSQAVVPAQRIRDGVVRLQVVEGYVSEVLIQGEAKDRLGLLPRMAEKIKASRPLRMADMERYVLLADDLPGVTVKTVLEASPDTPGASRLTLTLERTPVEGFVSLDNRGTRSVGPMQLTGAVNVEDQLGLFERTAAQGIVTQQVRELRFFDVGQLVPVDAEGTTVEYGVRRSWSKPGDSVRPLELDGLTTSARIGLSHPFIRSRAQTLRAGLSFTLRDTRTDALGDRLSEDRLRILSATVSYDFADGWGGANLLTAELSKGLDILGATRSGSAGLTRSGGRSDFRKLNVVAQRNQPLSGSTTLVLSGEAQYSPDQLLSSEEYGIGGKLYGRAFDPSELTGDSGIAGRAEFQYMVPVGGDGLDYAMAYGFGDYGAVWNHEAGTRHGRRSLASAGIGLRIGLFGRVDAGVELAKPFLATPISTLDRDPRVFFTLSSRF
ncbi:ShlB/FhaC/HecB family hemolysin secretion/activation protein [Azospirillum picis]|uniref:Hemolysin activation/secretion protein n=1 Tax=Azospirillum picis TaxID=488438 RepID=A0ABU0MTB8_9PROT|nr:ShlB/FhaC/HecB family hemolysin secretion/activation protein [Azospirillum picis]MBP2302911.1 hemolysin activation/secretion protein [Azospirillum picis]MDQ0536584.1 hemolysin activation/secretion protein [Azospirillum picis]